MAHPFHNNKEEAKSEGKRTKRISGVFQFGVDRSYGKKLKKMAKKVKGRSNTYSRNVSFPDVTDALRERRDD